MPEFQENFIPARKYLPAVLRQNSMGWYIEYYAYNQITQGLERKRMRLNRERKRARTFAEFRSIATQMIIQINCQLASGWSPFSLSAQKVELVSTPVKKTPVIMKPIELPLKESRQQDECLQEILPKASKVSIDSSSIDIIVLLDRFLLDKKRELTDSSLRSYHSFCKRLRFWILEFYPDLKSNEFTKLHAARFMEYVLNAGERKSNLKNLRHGDGTISNSAYNSNIKYARALFNWAIEKCYCEVNPFEKIKSKREESKIRTLIPDEDRKRIRDYFMKHKPYFLMVCDLVYSSLIRPIEITRIQVKMINLNEGYITLPATITKNHKERRARLTDELREMLAKHIMGANPDDYLFADGVWRCGKVPIVSSRYSKTWDKMRVKLGLPKEMQLYSLRDTGINGMLKAGIDPLSVMQAADHSDLSITTRYANHTDPELFKKLNELAPKF